MIIFESQYKDHFKVQIMKIITVRMITFET